jgi:hypothetical protein
MTSWMDLEDIPITPDSPDTGEGFPASIAIVKALVDAEVRAPRRRFTVVMHTALGFSFTLQGQRWIGHGHVFFPLAVQLSRLLTPLLQPALCWPCIDTSFFTVTFPPWPAIGQLVFILVSCWSALVFILASCWQSQALDQLLASPFPTIIVLVGTFDTCNFSPFTLATTSPPTPAALPLHIKVAAGTPRSRVLIGGFSQGGALALTAALTFDEPVAAACCLSAWAPPSQELPAAAAKLAAAPTPTKFLVCHGTSDGTVVTECGKRAHAMLTGAGLAAELKLYPGMAHGSCAQEITDVVKFIGDVLS